MVASLLCSYQRRFDVLLHYYADGLVQERRNSSALAMELRLSCTNPSHDALCPLWLSNFTRVVTEKPQVVITPTLSSLLTLEIITMTIYDAISEKEAGTMTLSSEFWIYMFMSVWRICRRLWHCGLSLWQPARRRQLSDRYYDDVIPSV